MDIKEITKPVREHLDEFDKYFKKMMKSKVSLLDLIVGYITKKRGKRVRPTLVFLSAKISGGISERTFVAAAMSELLHTATLVHDDVVDESSERRGIKSINSAWTNKIAVLFGDYLLSRGLLAAIDNDEFDFLKALSLSIKRMSEGELLQIQKSKEMTFDEEVYFKIISDKTASLIANCCQIGAMSATDDTAIHQTLYEYGELIGLAFQIRDDIFDYISKRRQIGKPVGNDLKEKKITLPLIYSLNQAEKPEAKKILKLVKNGNLKKKNINTIVKFVTDHNGIDYAKQKAESFADEAIAKLDIFEESEEKNTLINFAKFVINREL
jgi:octaprenyl-diphosphate synthase